MKTRLAAVLMVALLVAGIVASVGLTYAGSEKGTRPSQYESFTLTAAGTAYDKTAHETVDVSLSLAGEARGQLKTTVQLKVKGGELTVTNYDDIFASRGNGLIIKSCKFVTFSITLTGKYGGKTTCCVLNGKITKVSGDTVEVTLSSRVVVLPLPGQPVLKNLQLKGTIILK